jgi:hypothetical protein
MDCGKGGGFIVLGKEPRNLITYVTNDSCAVCYALTMRPIMALEKSTGSSSSHISTGTRPGGPPEGRMGSSL